MSLADAIVIYTRPSNVRKFTNQTLVWINLESPPNSMSFTKKDRIDWTATYRLDSVIPSPYGKFTHYDRTVKQIRSLRNYASKRTKSVAWVASNCILVRNNRLSYAKELGKHIDVDIYGKCGSLSCPNVPDCLGVLNKTYKFYLSFENSNCKDYITEKFFHNALG